MAEDVRIAKSKFLRNFEDLRELFRQPRVADEEPRQVQTIEDSACNKQFKQQYPSN